MTGKLESPLPVNEALQVLERRAALKEGRPAPWEEVAAETHHSKTRVLSVWKWFQGLSWEEARALAGQRDEVLRLRPDYLERKGEELRKRAAGGDLLLVRRIERHHADLLGLVEEWRSQLSQPLWNNSARDVGGPGLHRGEGGLVWEVGDGGLRLGLPLTVDTDAGKRLLWGSLCGHLETGGHLSLLRKLVEWETVGGQELQARARLLGEIDRHMAERLAAPDLASVRRAQGQATPLFAVALSAVLLDGIHLDYVPIEGSEEGRFTAYGGAFAIGVATTREAAHWFQIIHQRERDRLKDAPLTQEVRALMIQREHLAESIDGDLAEFRARGHVPGQCALCPPEV